MDRRRIRPADRVRASHLRVVERDSAHPGVVVVRSAPPPSQSPLGAADPVVRERGGTARAGLARVARALRAGWAAIAEWIARRIG
jgi:hypothetical protein